MLPETLHIRETPVTLIHHAANCGHQEPSTSLAALKRCLESGAYKVEIDVIPLADASFALLHDPDLAAQTGEFTCTVGIGLNVVRGIRIQRVELYTAKNAREVLEQLGAPID